MDRENIKKIVSRHRHEKAAIFAILHELQEEDKQLDVDLLEYTAQLLKVPFANVYGLATFYSAFSTSKKGETEIRVCDGISCYIKGSQGFTVPKIFSPLLSKHLMTFDQRLPGYR